MPTVALRLVRSVMPVLQTSSTISAAQSGRGQLQPDTMQREASRRAQKAREACTHIMCVTASDGCCQGNRDDRLLQQTRIRADVLSVRVQVDFCTLQQVQTDPTPGTHS